MSKKIRLARPGYCECRKIISRLKIFKDLARYNSPYGADHNMASRPLEDLISKDKLRPRLIRDEAIRHYINKLIPLVRRDLFYAKINVNVISTRIERGEEVTREYDLILDFFQYVNRTSSLDMIVGSIDRGIGFYEDFQKRRFWDLFNPLAWLALIIKIPLIIIQKADLVEDEEAGSRLMKLYGWAVKSLMLILLLFIAKKLGVYEAFISWFGK